MNFDNTNIDWVLGALLIALIDFVLLTIAFFKRRIRIENQDNSDFAILVPIFNKVEYLKNIQFLSENKDKVYILTTTKESEEFNRELEKICNINSFKLFKADIGDKDPTPWILYSIALHGKSMDSEMISNKNIILLDGDTYSNDNLSNLVYSFAKSELDLASLCILPDKPFSIAEKVQYVEYYIAMQVRNVLPHLTSGAAMIGKKEVLKRIFARHSMFFQGGDIEVGFIAKKMTYSVGYIPFTFFTSVPFKFTNLIKQRLSWGSGTFRIFFVNIFQVIKNHPWEIFYTIGFIYVLWYLKLVSLVIYFPIVFLISYLIYIVFLSLITFKSFYLSVFLSPLFSIVQSFILFPIGIIVYLRRVCISKNFGWIKVSDPRRNVALLIGNHSLHSNILELEKPKK